MKHAKNAPAGSLDNVRPRALNVCESEIKRSKREREREEKSWGDLKAPARAFLGFPNCAVRRFFFAGTHNAKIIIARP